MTLRCFVRWVRGLLGLGRKYRSVTPTSVVERCSPVTRGPKLRQVVEKPSGCENEATPVPTGIGFATPENNEETTLVGLADPNDQTQVAKTQFPNHGTEIIDLVIGLDFGTLSTRVVVRSPYMGDGRAVPVSWHLQSGTPPHFLPVALCGDPDVELTLARDWKKNENGNLKTDLMDNPDDLLARARVAAYLGLTLRQARGYVLHTQTEAYGPYQIRWAVHVGIPSKGYADYEVKDAFLCVARAAWRLSRCSEPMTLGAAMAELQRANGKATIEDDPELTRVEVIPEIAAQVAGYARSRRRREGLHVMMDVGASTVDICGFGLQDKHGDDQYFLHTTRVERFGIRELHHRRMDMIAGANAEHALAVARSLDPFSDVPAAGADYLTDLEHALGEALASVDDQYESDCTNALTKVILELKGKRDPNSETWTSGLPLFISGGGGRHPIIVRAVKRADVRLATMTDAKGGILVRSLPTLEGLADVRGSPWGTSHDSRQDKSGDQREDAERQADQINWNHEAERLGVAFGLSFDSFDIGHITPPHKIEDVPRMRRAKPTEYISKDQV